MQPGRDAAEETCSLLIHTPSSLKAELLRGHFTERSDFEVVGAGATYEETVELARRWQPDVIVVHDGTPDGGALPVVKELSASREASDVVVFGVADEASIKLEFLEAGARSCVAEGASLEELENAFREIHRGHTSLDSDLAYRTIGRLARLSTLCERMGLDMSRLQRLTSREEEVLELLGEALTNAEIADRLSVAVSTVKSHVHSILDKLDAPNRRWAARYLLLTEGENGEGLEAARPVPSDNGRNRSRRAAAAY